MTPLCKISGSATGWRDDPTSCQSLSASRRTNKEKTSGMTGRPVEKIEEKALLPSCSSSRVRRHRDASPKHNDLQGVTRR
ncbi:unnamed protein product [Linum trigynum]|uniref:Uncharacterized protein n=1 Tax=Linum trigynum TaxID=586398 RepID=A0AAV2CMK2_9ROSI